MKQCRICSAIKDESLFCTKKYKDGVRITRSICKSCDSDKAKQRYADESQEDRERRKLIARQWRDRNRCAVNNLKRKYRAQAKTKKLCNVKHEQHVIEYDRHVYKQSLKIHDSHVKDRNIFIRYCVYQRLKRGVERGLRDKKANSNWFSYLGYGTKDLIKHIENQFVDGMGWHNMPEWHIDHIIPIRSFNLTGADCEDFKQCYALDNLRPIWAEENIRKYHKEDKWLIKKKKGTGTIFFTQG